MSLEQTLKDARVAVKCARPIRALILGDWDDDRFGDPPYLMVLLADGTRISGALSMVSPFPEADWAKLEETDPELFKELEDFKRR